MLCKRGCKDRNFCQYLLITEKGVLNSAEITFSLGEFVTNQSIFIQSKLKRTILSYLPILNLLFIYKFCFELQNIFKQQIGIEKPTNLMFLGGELWGVKFKTNDPTDLKLKCKTAKSFALLNTSGKSH